MAGYREINNDPTKINADDLLNMFKLNADLPKYEVLGGRVKTPLKRPVAAPTKSYVLPDDDQMAYVNEYVEENPTDLHKFIESNNSQKTPLSQMTEIEEESNVGAINDTNFDSNTEKLKHYDFTCRYNEKLPTTRRKDEIIAAIENQQVLIIEGSTGSGKTTQVPQFILDHCQEHNKYCNIIVTQPRRIAAISIAKRVCHERGWQLGGLVGYKVGMDHKSYVSRDTCLTYVTTGIFLKQLVNKKTMDGYSHVILDEVHERDRDMDFVLLIVRKFLRSCNRQVKVILMSASFDVARFGHYFVMPFCGRMEQPVCIRLESTKHPISEYWLNDLEPLGELPEIDEKRPKIDDKAFFIVRALLKTLDSIECQEQNAPFGKRFAPIRGGVLIFLPGLDEIKRLDQILTPEKLNYQWWILTLHSSLTDQAIGDRGLRVFEKPQGEQRKVILSTNIAESSITVPDIVYVVDFCLTKNLICDRQTNYTSLQLEWASKANCLQRKGRTGRIDKGRVYRMVSKEFYKHFLPEYATPEMKRCPLESVVLNTKVLDIGEPKAVLAFALDPPKLGDIERSVLILKEVGALDNYSKGHLTPFDGDLTLLGSVLAQLPVDVHIGKLIMLGYIFGFLDECLIISAGLSIPTIFTNIYGRELECWNNKVAFSSKSFSDCFAILHAYKAWKKRRDEQSFNTDGLRNEKDWGRHHFVLTNKLRDMEFLIDELKNRLEKFNICIRSGIRDAKSAEDMLILKLLITGAFYPHYFVRGDQDEREIARALSGKDPCNTVVLSGLPLDHACLYKHDIEQMFREYQIRTTFENSRCFVEFQRTPTQEFGGVILAAVYIAVKRRLLREKFTIATLDYETVRRELQAIELIKERKDSGNKSLSSKISLTTRSGLDKPIIPSINRNLFYIKVIWQPDHDFSHFSNFWAQYDEQETEKTLHKMLNVVNSSGIQDDPEILLPVVPGLMCLAPCVNVKHPNVYRPYCRARVEEVHGSRITVTFFDYGYVESVQKKELRVLDTDEFPVLDCPALAFEFVLAQIKPPAEYIHTGWTKDAISFIKRKTVNAPKNYVYCEVFSVVKRIFHVRLFVADGGRKLDITDELIKRRWAETAEESYLSKQNHCLREEYNERPDCGDRKMADYDEDDDCLYVGDVCDSRSFKHTKNKIVLRGPSSPLEVTFASLQKCGILRPVRIEMSSVNSVVLDAEPQDVCARMMVGSAVGYNASNEVMLVRNTTLLPNIHNLPALVSMVFAPRVEMRVDVNCSRYTGILCGLGYDEKYKTSLYEEHDMEIAFDTQIDEIDLRQVNQLRIEINGYLRQSFDSPTTSIAPDSQNKVCKLLKDLICKQRKTTERTYFRRSFQWVQIPEERILYQQYDDEDRSKILINGIRLMDTEKQNNYFRMKYLQEHGKESFERIKCLFCDVDINSYNELKIHLKLIEHKQNVNLLFGIQS